MSAPLVFLDTETTGLSLDDDIWELAAIRREPDGSEEVLHLFIEHDRDKCARLPERFREDHYKRYPHPDVRKWQACLQLSRLLVGRPHIVGAVPNFDTERLFKLFRENFEDYEPQWHHRLRCVETLTAGHLGRDVGGLRDCMVALGLPFDESDEHTALGDARAAMAIWDRVMNYA